MTDLSEGGDISTVGFLDEAVLQALLQLVDVLLHIANTRPGTLHRPAHRTHPPLHTCLVTFILSREHKYEYDICVI